MTVYLVGAGPGDPELLTVRGARALAEADVVIYDRLSVASLLDLAPPEAERISVGKAPGRVERTQEQINELLVEHGRSGRNIVRLKGGDPFVFARGGEECAALAAAGVEFEIVPGITSAIAVPAYAGIPVTLRHSSTSFTVVTGHEDPTVAGPEGTVDWDAVARVGGTIVVLMGVANRARIAARLVAAGRPADTPVAAVTWGTRPNQRTVRATLGTIGATAVASPAVLVIGAVAAQDLSWFESRPLFGRSVVVTRTRSQASALSVRLRRAGAAVVEVPTIAIEPPADGGAALAAAAGALDGYEWVVVTSPNGAARLLDAVGDARRFGRAKVAAVGPATAGTLRDGGIIADLVPERYVAESLLDALGAPALPGSADPAAGGRGPAGRILLARAAVARDVLPDGLRAAGWEVEVVEAYRTVPVVPDPAALDRIGEADCITFASSSAVTSFLAAYGRDAVPATVCCIGPITAATAREAGLEVAVTAPVHTVDGLVDAMVTNLGNRP